MSGYYAKNPHYAPDDFSEERERLGRCEVEAGRWFADATKDQQATYDLAMAGLRGLDAPRYDRARNAAQRVWHTSTAPARALYEETVRELMATGEVSEALADRWEALDTEHAVAA